MASNTTGSENRLSFAKIAAMPPPSQSQSSDPTDEKGVPQPEEASSESHGSKDLPGHQNGLNDSSRDDNPIDRDVNSLSKTVHDVRLNDHKDQEGSVASAAVNTNGVLKRETSFEDDRTHLSNSSTKPTSFDSKSMASVTTFAMDEKDSLRPDDSASVQAVDEEESLSGPASGVPNSLMGSESGARVPREHARDSAQKPRAILRSSGAVLNDGGAQTSGTIPPDSVSNNFVTPTPEVLQGGAGLNVFPLEPDEKLLEAMKTPKDRLLILQLEEKITHFLKHSKDQSLELPPSNAFGRLLAHKLGDYYHLTHFVDNNVTSVRLHRTPFCRLPTPLSAIHAARNATPPPAAPPMRIMRRTGPSADGSAAGSGGASKTTSEAGESGNDGDRAGSSASATPAKDRMILSREEKEVKYQKARERIFSDFPDPKTSDNNQNGDNNMSRTSSASGRKKPHKQKLPHDDTFEVRSQYNVYYPGVHHYNGPVPYASDGSFSNEQPYMVGPGVSPAGMTYVQNGPNNLMYPGPANMNTLPPYPVAVSPQVPQSTPWHGGSIPQQSPFSGYASLQQQPTMMGPEPSHKTSPAMNNYPIPSPMPYQHMAPSWQPPQYPGSLQQPAYRNQPPVHWPSYPSHPMAPGSPSYPYGQFPGQPMNPGIQNPPGPIPESFNRSLFNPQTRSFVPGSRHPGKGNQYRVNTYLNAQQGVQPPQWTPRFPEASPSSAMGGYNPNRLMSTGNRDSIAKWGTPSHLPPKPPPSEVPSDFDMKHRSTPTYAANGLAQSSNGPFVVSGGTGLPSQH